VQLRLVWNQTAADPGSGRPAPPLPGMPDGSAGPLDPDISRAGLTASAGFLRAISRRTQSAAARCVPAHAAGRAPCEARSVPNPSILPPSVGSCRTNAAGGNSLPALGSYSAGTSKRAIKLRGKTSVAIFCFRFARQNVRLCVKTRVFRGVRCVALFHGCQIEQHGRHKRIAAIAH
jgi:hypothetical protein